MKTLNMSYLIAFIFYCMLVNMINAQTTSDCGTTYSCYLTPVNCVDTGCDFIYKWKNTSNNIDFVLAAKFSSTSNKWLGIGFSNDQSMGSDSVVICKSTNAVQTYYNIPYGYYSSVMDSSNPTFGLSSTSVTTSNGFLICSFSRQIKISAANNYFYDLSQSYYVLAAAGSLQTKRRAAGDLKQHDYAYASGAKLTFTTLSFSYNSGISNKQTHYGFKFAFITALVLQFSIYGMFIKI